MPRKLALLLLLAAAPAWARDTTSAWVEVSSPHFTVVTDAGDKQGRRVADQFERMRWVFQKLFPKSNVDPVSPIVVIAVKNKKGLESLEPEAYRGRDQLALAGLFQRTPDRNYILMRLDAQGDHPWSTIYHEYTHLELGSGIEWLPLWLNEGLAEFFQNTEFRDNDVLLGEPSEDNLLYLQQHSLIPLPVLFRVDATSPYYHEEQKGSVFYAESWALTHYLETTDTQEHTDRVSTYIHLIAQNQDPVTAAEQAFGDLKKLQDTLESYTRRAQYSYFRMSSAAYSYFRLSSTGTPVEESFTTVPLTPPQADAIRADFLAASGRTADARALLTSVLQSDLNNVQAQETMGFLALRADHLDEAKKWYQQVMALDKQNYRARYYYAVLRMMQGSAGDDVESDLRTAIQLDPRFAPAYDRLAALYAIRRSNLEEANKLNLQAVQLDPGNLNYRLNTANVLMMLGRYSDAVAVLKIAQQVAKTPLEAAVVQRMMDKVNDFRAHAVHANP
jgi:tetratricopeptide (TPR) repeat protein